MVQSLFLQEADYVQRAEELLDKALALLEEKSEPFFLRWKLKICLSLGYVHQSQCNYVDADFYLKEAAELTLMEPHLSKFLGEIYSHLADVNLNLNRYTQAKKYVTLEKEISYEKYRKTDCHSQIRGNNCLPIFSFCQIWRKGSINSNQISPISKT